MGQSGKNIVVAFKEQSSGLGNPESSGSGATALRVTPSQGVSLQAAEIQSNEIRKDGQTKLGRLGSYFAPFSYSAELSVGSFDDVFEAVLRGTWTAAISLDEATNSLGTISIASNVITNSGGSWLTEGLFAGQMIQLTNTGVSANNGVWHRVLAVTASTITVAASPGLTDSGSETTWDLTVAKHLTPDDPPTERYFTLEETYQDIDESLVAEDCKFGGFELSVSPDNHVTITLTGAGTDVGRKESANSPHFTSPTLATTKPLVLLDGSIRVNGSDVLDLTGFSISFNANPQNQPVIGQRKSPDIFMSQARGSGSVTGVVNDLAEFAAFKAETGFDVFIVAAENEADPADFISIYIGDAAYRGHDKPFGQDGALLETLPFSFGIDDEAGTGYASAMMVISSSAA